MRTTLRIASALAALAGLFPFAAPALVTNNPIETAGLVGVNLSMALTPGGNPLLAYWDQDGDTVKLAICSDPACATAPTLRAFAVGTAQGFQSVASTSDGRAVVAYTDEVPSLKLAVCNDATCTSPTITTVIGSVPSPAHVSLQLKSGDIPVFAYRSGGLRIAVCGTPDCSVVSSDVAVDGVNAFSPSLQLNGNLPVVSYIAAATQDLKLAVCADATCSTVTLTTVDAAGDVGDGSTLRLDSAGNPVITYEDGTNDAIKLAICSDPTCATVPTFRSFASQVFGGLALSGNVPLVALSNGSIVLRLATCADATCSSSVTRVLDPANGAGYFPRVALGANGRIVVGHQRGGLIGDVYLSNFTPATVTSVNVPANDTYGAGRNLDFTVNWSEDITVDTTGGTPRIALTIGAATRYADYFSGSGTAALVFRYTVAAPDVDANGIAVGALEANGGTIRDSVTFDATLTLNGLGSTTGVLVETTPPAVNTVAVPADGTYRASQDLDFTVNWSETVIVDTAGGTPRIALTIGSTTREATYFSGSGTSALVFRHTVVPGDLDANGITVGTLTVNGGTIRDAAGNDATLTLNSVGSTAAVNVDAVGPAVNSVFVPINGTYVSGDVMNFIVFFDENIVSTGAPQLELTIGATTRFASLTGATPNSLSFGYTVQPGDNDADGIAVSALVLNGGTIRDGPGNDAILTLNGVGNTSLVYVDTGVPGVNTVGVPAPGNYTAGMNLDFTVNWNEVVAVTGTPQIELTIGAVTRQAAYLSGTGTSALLFRYTVVAGDHDPDGITVGALALNGGTIRDAALNNAALALNGVGSTAAVFVHRAVTTFSAPTATGTGIASVTLTGGGPTCTLTAPQFIPLTGHARSPPAGTAPTSYTFPHGLFDFTTTLCTPGSTITVSVTYPTALPAGTQYWKYGPTPSNATPHWYTLAATIAGSTATFNITDGQIGDDDLAVNGTIVDQGGPGIPGSPGTATAIPTLSEWMLMLLAALMLLTVIRRERQRPEDLL